LRRRGVRPARLQVEPDQPAVRRFGRGFQLLPATGDGQGRIACRGGVRAVLAGTLAVPFDQAVKD